MDVITTCGNTRVSTVVFDHCRVMQLLLDEYYNINIGFNKHGCYIVIAIYHSNILNFVPR